MIKFKVEPSAEVQFDVVPQLGGGVFPEGTEYITENGMYDVTLKQYADVQIPDPPLQNKTVTENGTITADEDYYGLDTVIVDVPQPSGNIDITQNGTVDVTDYETANVDVQPMLQSKSVTENGTVTADEGYDGLSAVEVNVPVPPAPVYQERSITENGTYYPEAGYDAMSKVEVDVHDTTDHYSYPFKEDSVVVIDEGTTQIGQWALAYSVIGDLYWADSLTSTATNSFSNADVLRLHISNLKKYMECGFGSAGFPLRTTQSVGTINSQRHIYMNANEILDLVIPDGINTIKDSTFGNCINIRSITIPNSVISIGGGVFANTAITELKIPNSVATIAAYAFRWIQANAVNYDFTEFELVDGALPVTFGTQVFQAIKAGSKIIFKDAETAAVAKTTTNLAMYAAYITYPGEVTE